MVRLRKNRWYSLENQHALGKRASAQSSGYRRLISLTLLLALVVLMMQKISDPAVVRRAFQNLGVPLNGQLHNPTQPNATSTATRSHGPQGIEQSTSQQASARPAAMDSQPQRAQWVATCDDLIARILQSASMPTIKALAEFSFTQPATQREPVTQRELETRDPATEQARLSELIAELADLRKTGQGAVDRARELLKSADQPDQAANDYLVTYPEKSTGSEDWLESLDRFGREWPQLLAEVERFHANSESESTIAEWPSEEIRGALVTYLDQRLGLLLRDGAPWRPAESLAFWRLLQRGHNFEYPTNTDPPLLTTQQLQSEHSKLKFQWIRFRGTVRRIDRVQRSDPFLQIEQYRVLWLQGADNSSQPVAVYATLPLAEQLEAWVASEAFPDVELIGLVGKRLAYASADGLQTAPTLFAGSLIQFVPNAVSSAQTSTQSDSALTQPVMSALLAGGILGLLLLALIWTRGQTSNRLARRSGIHKTLAVFGLLFIPAPQSFAAQSQPPWAGEEQSQLSIKTLAQQRLNDAAPSDRFEQLMESLNDRQTTASDWMLKILYALNQLGWDRVWSTGSIIELGSQYRLRPVELEGWAVNVQSLALSGDQQEWFSVHPQTAVYRMVLAEVDSDRLQPSIISLNAPRLWLESPKLKQPASFRGFAFERQSQDSGDANQQTSQLCVLAEAPRWTRLKNQPDSFQLAQPALPKHWLELADFDWDCYWFELLRNANEKAISPWEREPFQKLLQLTSHGGLGCDSQPGRPMDVLARPEEFLGCCVDWEVRLVQGSRVEWPAREASPPFEYYQFDGFVKIPGQKVEYLAAGGAERILFEGEFPVTIVTTTPHDFAGQQSSAAGQPSWKIGRHARVQGRFYRIWSYRSQRLETDDRQGRQLAPLIAGATMEAISPTPPPESPIGWFGTVLCIGVVLILVGIIISVTKDTFSGKSRRRA